MFLQAEEITLTIGQAFELAYKKFLESKGTFEFARAFPTQFFREIIVSILFVSLTYARFFHPVFFVKTLHRIIDTAKIENVWGFLPSPNH